MRCCSRRRIGTTQAHDRWSRLLRVQDLPCGWWRPTSNKRMQLTKRGANTVGGAASRPGVTESRFAADPWCSTDRRQGRRDRTGPELAKESRLQPDLKPPEGEIAFTKSACRSDAVDEALGSASRASAPANDRQAHRVVDDAHLAGLCVRLCGRSGSHEQEARQVARLNVARRTAWVAHGPVLEDRGKGQSNKRMQLTKREAATVGGAASRPSIIESRFAADPQCSADPGARVGP